MTLTTTKTNAYGLYRAVGVRADGAPVEALGTTPERAESFAQVRAATWERCEGCGRCNVPPMEAHVSRRAYRGRVFCPGCRSSSEGPNGDYERDAVYEG